MPGRRAGGNHRKSLVTSLEASLRRLRIGYVDILWLHSWDYLTPPEEVMRALNDQVRLGKVLYLGISDTPAWAIAQMQTLAVDRGWSAFAGLQVEYSLVQREVERELIPMAITAWDRSVLGCCPASTPATARPPGDRRLTEVRAPRIGMIPPWLRSQASATRPG
jgi:Aldo/keto reductase family